MKTEVLKEFEGKFVWVHYEGFPKGIGGVFTAIDEDFCIFRGIRGEYAKRKTVIATNKIISIDYNDKDQEDVKEGVNDVGEEGR